MKIILLAAILLSSFGSPAQIKHYQINIPVVTCHKTTEDGDDEIYLLLSWKSSRKGEGSVRLPFNSHFNITDTRHPDLNGVPSSIGVGTILDLALGDNDWIDVFCSIMEQDDGTAAQYNEVGRQVMAYAHMAGKSIFSSITGNLFKEMLAGVARKYKLVNPDDWIGSFSYRITKPAGRPLIIQCRQIRNPASNAGFNQATTVCQQHEKKPVDAAGSNQNFSFSGEGSNYDIRVTITDL